MASVQDRLKLKRESCDTWSTREQLCLASSVLKSGDQNWISVSRSLRPFAEKEALRPPDWFSQKSCAIQYAILLENADTPKRKKRESGETTGESIVRRLTQERITELGQILAFQRDEYQQLKNEVNLLKSGNISDEKLKKMWEAIEQEEREAEQKARAHSAWLAKRQQKNEAPTTQTTPSTPKKTLETPPETQELQELQPETEEEKKSRGGRSPLLTSLLKSPSPTTQIQNPPSTAQTTSPTIASLLGASTKVQSPQKPTNAPPQFHHVVTSILTPSVAERPSVGAPTLSMLLELPSNLSRGNLANIQTASNQNSLKEPLRTKISNHVTSPIPAANVPVTESMVQIIDHIDDVIGNDKMPEVIDKDEINEIIGDIEELIKEEITKSPKGTEPAAGIIEAITAPSVETKIVRDVDENVSSNSPHSEMAIEEIDQSTSSIAEIIGTAIEPKPKVIVQAIHPDVPIIENEAEKQEVKEEVSMDVAEDTETVEPKQEADDQEEEKEDKAKIEEESPEEKTISEEVPDPPKSEVKSPEPEAIVPDCKDEKKEEDDEGGEVEEEREEEGGEEEEKEAEREEEAETAEKEEEAKEEVMPKIEEAVSVVPEEQTESKEILEVKSEDNNSPATEEEEPEVKEESSLPESDEKTEPTEDPEELSPKPEDRQSEDEKPECEDVSPEAEEKSEIADDKPTKEEKSPETPGIKEEDSNSNDSNTKAEVSEELKEEKKSPEDSSEKMEELEEEMPKKFEDNSPKEDSEEELEPPVLPNEVEDTQVEKREDEEETKPESQAKESEDEQKSESINPIEEESIDEKTEGETNSDEKEPKLEKEEMKKDEADGKKEEAAVSAADDTEVEEEESSLTKLPARAMKTYSKKQNAVADSEAETESDADYKAWRKSILLHYSRLATHKYASLFLRPITEDHAPGYHSVVFRPMDLSTIKKNIDNGTIRTTMQFQRDVMLMFQNAIMYNKSDSFVYKMAVSMQEECLQSVQILVEATGEGAYRRETRTAASSSSETSESSIIKRKRSHITPSPLDIDSPRMKKRRKSEND